MRTTIPNLLPLAVWELTSERIVSLYLYGQEAMPTALYDRLRPGGEGAVEVQVDAGDWFANGGGRFVNPARFDVVSRFFDDAVFGGVIDPGTYTFDQVTTLFPDVFAGASSLRTYADLTSHQVLYDDGRADLIDRAFLFGTEGYELNDSILFHVDVTGSNGRAYSVSEISITRDRDNFDFVSNNPLSIATNAITEPQIGPRTRRPDTPRARRRV